MRSLFGLYHYPVEAQAGVWGWAWWAVSTMKNKSAKRTKWIKAPKEQIEKVKNKAKKTLEHKETWSLNVTKRKHLDEVNSLILAKALQFKPVAEHNMSNQWSGFYHDWMILA